MADKPFINPCPRCGATSDHTTLHGAVVDGKGLYHLDCDECGYRVEGETARETVERWNHVPLSQQDKAENPQR